MRKKITTFPPRGVSIYQGNYGTCTATFYKDLQNETLGGEETLTADVERMDLHYYDGLQEELESDFEVNFEKARLAGLEIAKDNAMNAIKGLLIQTDYKSWKHSDGALTDAEYEPTKTERAELRTLYNAVETAMTIEELEKIFPQKH